MTIYENQPEKVSYIQRADGTADVRIRMDIQEVNSPEGIYWTAEEAYRNTRMSEAEVLANADALFFQWTGLQADLTAAVQEHMDKTAQTRNYDNIFTACSYANSTDPRFKSEGEACVAWRDAVWNTCYAILAAVKAGQRHIPTVDELIAELPALEW